MTDMISKMEEHTKGKCLDIKRPYLILSKDLVLVPEDKPAHSTKASKHSCIDAESNDERGELQIDSDTKLALDCEFPQL